MKYIMIDAKINGIDRLVPIIFPNELIHKSVAARMEEQIRRETREFCGTVSAGFYNPDSGQCFGESESLGLKSDPERDSQVISTNDHLHGMVK